MAFVVALVAVVLGFVAWRKAEAALTEVQGLRALLLARQGAPVQEGAPVQTVMPPLLPLEAGPDADLAMPVPPPLPAAPPPLPGPVRPAMDIERLLTQRWGIWLGGFAILLAGVFLIRTAAERGWMGPGARCAEGLALGLALIAGAFWLRRRPVVAMPFADYGPSALAAGGVATLFAAAYGVGPLYGLVPSPVGFGLMALVAVAGLGLSLLFGQMVAALGLLAAFATPALVQTKDPSLPGLFGYLLVVSAACWGVVRYTAWTWLGWGAALAGAAWVMLTSGAPAADAWAPGLFVPAAVALTLALLPEAAVAHPVGRRFAWAPLVMLGLAGLVLASVSQDGAARAGLLMLAPIAMVKAWREPRLAWLPMVTAGLSVLALLAWFLPVVQATAEAITIEGVVQAILPGPFAPEAIIPFLQVAAGIAVLHAAAGLWGERRTPSPLAWAALTAGVPVLVLAAAYMRVGRFQPESAWALAAGLLAAGLVGAAGLARREGSIQRAGVHAAGAVAALSLGCAIVLDAAWLTVALALMLPALAWIEAAAGLPALRRVALVLAGVVLVRLVLNPYLPGYAVGAAPVLNALLIAYGIPAVCFALAARLFGARLVGARRDALVDVLVAGACLFGGLLLLLEIRQWQHKRAMWTANPGFGEAAWMVTVLGAYALALQALAARGASAVLGVAWRLAGGLALMGGCALLVLNPFFVGMAQGQGVFGNDLLPAYLLPAVLALFAVVRGVQPRLVLGGYGLLALLMWCSAAVRQAFHPGMTAFWEAGVEDAELWALSGAWSVLAACTLAAGIALRQRALRLAGLALVVLVVAKVFLVDMSGLEGLWRVLSFLGLGLGLIGLGAAYRRFGTRL